MKFWTLIVSYLGKDTCLRWLEQPGSPFARWSVALILVGVTGAILISLESMERHLRVQLQQFGMETLVIRETITSNDPELVSTGQRINRLALLSANSSLIQLRQLFVQAKTEWQNDLLIFTYWSHSSRDIVQMQHPKTPLLCLSTTLPENILVKVTVNEHTYMAATRQPSQALRPLASANPILLIPQGWLPEIESHGHIETNLIERGPEAPAMSEIVSAIQILTASEKRKVQIQSPLQIIQSWHKIEKTQRQYRTTLGSALGIALALIFGVISAMEFRQNIYLSALLRSFGVPSILLWFRQWIENAGLANLAAISALALLFQFQEPFLNELSSPQQRTPKIPIEFFFGNEIISIFIWVNIGALISSFPIAVGLRKPVGAILA